MSLKEDFIRGNFVHKIKQWFPKNQYWKTFTSQQKNSIFIFPGILYLNILKLWLKQI